jgi:hypothetical protein
VVGGRVVEPVDATVVALVLLVVLWLVVCLVVWLVVCGAFTGTCTLKTN